MIKHKTEQSLVVPFSLFVPLLVGMPGLAAKSEAGKVSEVVPDRALCAKPSALSTEAGSWYP